MKIGDAINHLEDLQVFKHEPTEEDIKALDAAIEALKKQIPNKTITIENNLIRNGCPVCKCVNEDGNNYCRFCGQRLDWEGWRL